ncbi:MAG: hypothetical protein GY816_05560 [Cytophagales bacterium]|nr:hypothetical protein [Cytophagales bacterium]
MMQHKGVEGRPFKFIFTHEEAALDSIESEVANHPKVERAFQDEGFWYSNGETGRRGSLCM